MTKCNYQVWDSEDIDMENCGEPSVVGFVENGGVKNYCDIHAAQLIVNLIAFRDTVLDAIKRCK